jgi:cytoskeletal protein CcmA (bactofilin family)
MWNKEDKPRGTAANPTPASPQPSVAPGGFDRERGEPMKEELASIGKSIIIKGELSGGEDLTIEGQVEGKIELRDHMLTIGPNGRIKAQIVAKSIVVLGQVTGNLTATDKVDIRENGAVEGDVAAPRIAIADGSHFRGSIDMQKQAAATDWAGVRKPETKAPMPVAAPVSDGRASA